MPTWNDIEPLLDSGWTTPEAGWQVLVRCEPIVLGVARRLWSRWHRTASARMDEGDLVQAILVSVMRKACAGRGLVASDRGGDAGRWLGRVCHNHGFDHLSRSPSVLAGPMPEHDRLAVPPSAEAALLLRRHAQAQVDALARLDLPPTQRLAFACLNLPHLVGEDLVHEAAGDLVRGPRTWRLLEEWLDAHEDRPQTTAARRHLAWILRSDDDRSPDAWRLDDPEAARRAQQLVAKWDRRAAARMKPLEDP